MAEKNPSPELVQEVFAHMLTWVELVTPEIDRYWKDGWMPVVALLPHRDVFPVLKELGWKGGKACFGVRRAALDSMMQYPSERRWLERPPATAGELRAFLFVQVGTFLLVKSPGKPWSFEPGTLDPALLS
jgi:hypothetical protein